jgi:hypothetical protein
VCSSSSSENDTNDDKHHGNITKLLTRKRKNPTTANIGSRKRQSRGPTCTKPMGRQGKLFMSQNDARPASETQSRSDKSGEDSSTSVLNPLSAPPCRGNDVRNGCSNDSSEDGSDDHFLPTEGIKRPMLAVRPHALRKHKPMRPDNTAGNDNEYEVQSILEARMSDQRLQYRAKWLGFKYNQTWYNSCNFKNSLYKLCNFHSVNASHPGPPKRLGTWIQYWEEDRDAEDYSDDDKP